MPATAATTTSKHCRCFFCSLSSEGWLVAVAAVTIDIGTKLCGKGREQGRYLWLPTVVHCWLRHIYCHHQGLHRQQGCCKTFVSVDSPVFGVEFSAYVW